MGRPAEERTEFPPKSAQPNPQLRGTFVLSSVVDVSARSRRNEAQQHGNELAHLSRVTMLGELSGSLAHELNQPLAAILPTLRRHSGSSRTMKSTSTNAGHPQGHC